MTSKYYTRAKDNYSINTNRNNSNKYFNEQLKKSQKYLDNIYKKSLMTLDKLDFNDKLEYNRKEEKIIHNNIQNIFLLIIAGHFLLYTYYILNNNKNKYLKN